MRHSAWLRLALAAPLSALLLAAAPLAHAQTAGCQLTLGFAELHDLIPDTVGSCTSDVTYLLNGDAVQRTTNGMLAWSKADNLVRFTDGATTWMDGPDGIVNRANGDRFPWEAPISQVAGVAISRAVDPASIVLRPGDPGVPRGYVLAGESTSPDGEYSLTLRSFFKPQEYIVTKVRQEPSAAAAQVALAAFGAGYPKSNRVAGQEGNGFQNDGTAFVGEQSTLIESKQLLMLAWMRGPYLLEIDDASQQGIGEPTVLARVVDQRLAQQLQAPV